MRKAVFAFVVSCSSFCVMSTLGMSTDSSFPHNREYDKLESLYTNLDAHKVQLEVDYKQKEEELKTARKELKKLEENYKNLEEYHGVIMGMYNSVSIRNEELEKENRELKIAQKNLETEISIMKQKVAAVNENDDQMLRDLSVISSERVPSAEKSEAESKIIESENTSKFWEENLQIAEESLIDMNDGYSITDSDLLDLYEYESQIERTNSGEVSEIFVENNNLKFEIDEVGGKISPNASRSSNVFQQTVDQIRKRLSIKFDPRNTESVENSYIDAERFLFARETSNISVAEKLISSEEIKSSSFDPDGSALRKGMILSEDTKNLRANSDSPLEKTKGRSDIAFKEDIIFASEIPDRTFYAKEYVAESPLSSSTKSDFGFSDTKFSLDNSEKKLERALREIQELKDALQKALDDKLKAENNSLRLKETNDNLVRQLSKKTLEIKKFRSDFSEICRNVAEMFARMDSDRETDQAKNFSKLSFIKDKLARINSIVRKSGAPIPEKLRWNKTSTLENHVKEKQKEEQMTNAKLTRNNADGRSVVH